MVFTRYSLLGRDPIMGGLFFVNIEILSRETNKKKRSVKNAKMVFVEVLGFSGYPGNRYYLLDPLGEDEVERDILNRRQYKTGGS